MKPLKNTNYILVFFLTLILFIPAKSSISNIVKYGNEFLEYGYGAREVSLGGAVTSSSKPVVASYWNPASLTEAKRMNVQLMHTVEFAGVVNNDQISFVYPGEDKINYGLSAFRTGVDNIPYTRNALKDLNNNNELDSDERLDYQKITYFNAFESALFASAGIKLNNNFSAGGSIKTIYKKLYDQYAFGMGFDVGAIYSPYPDLKLGTNIKDITTTFLFWKDGEKEIVPPTFNIGMNYKIKIEQYDLAINPLLGGTINFDGEENRVDLNYGNMNFRSRLGVEISYNELIAIRAGKDDIGSIKIGCGINTYLGNIDYGFSMGGSHSDLGNSHRVALTFHMKRLRSYIFDND